MVWNVLAVLWLAFETVSIMWPDSSTLRWRSPMAADLAILNARVRTLDPARPFASAVAVRAGTIIAVGDDVSDEYDARTEVIDARGAALIPGLTDSHLHPFWGAELARGVDLSRERSKADVLAALAAAEPERGWLFAWGLDYNAAPTPAEIADAVGGAAAFVRLSDLHTALATPRALELAQVTGPHAFAGCVRGRLRGRGPDGRAARDGRAGAGAARRAAAALAGDAPPPRRDASSG